MNNNTAILIIDVQKGMFDYGGPHESKQLIDKIYNVLEKARKNNMPIIYIQHYDNDENHPLHKSKDGFNIHTKVVPQNNDLVIEKNTPDSFYKTALQNKLKELNIENLIITGLMTEICIDTTIKSAYRLDYNISILKDGHSTYNNDKMNGKQIKEFYEDIWKKWFAKIIDLEDF